MNRTSMPVCILLGVLTGGFLFAQQPVSQQPTAPPTKKATPKKTQPAEAAKPQGLTADGIISMVQAGLSEDVIITRLRKDNIAFDLSPEEMIKLKKAGVGNDTLKVMMDPKADLTQPPPTPPPAPSVPTPTQAPSAPVNLAPTPGTTSTAPPMATATPASGKTADANAPAGVGPGMEIGVYNKKGEAWVEVLPEVVNWKTGGVLKTIGTAGIVKGDVNGHLEGPASRNSVKTPLEFLIVAPEGVAITEYQFIRLRTNKDYREFRTVTGGVMHVKGGATRDLVPFEGKKLSPRVFQVVLPSNIGAGEYGFLPPGAFGSANSASSLGKMFTFRVLE